MYCGRGITNIPIKDKHLSRGRRFGRSHYESFLRNCGREQGLRHLHVFAKNERGLFSSDWKRADESDVDDNGRNLGHGHWPLFSVAAFGGGLLSGHLMGAEVRPSGFLEASK